MTETEMKLALLLYNMLSKERADAAYMSAHTSEYAYDDEQLKCIAKMKKIRDDLRECGYEFASIGYKVVGKVQHEEYKIVPISNA